MYFIALSITQTLVELYRIYVTDVDLSSDHQTKLEDHRWWRSTISEVLLVIILKPAPVMYRHINA